MGGSFSVDKLNFFTRTGGKKRKREDSGDSSDTEAKLDVELDTPKRKRVKSTSKYIYQRLFLDGEGTDVTIVALGKEWHLHRLYLCQSGYFSSMFSGSWKESSQDTVHLNIPDDNIDEEALRVSFGSLYKDDVFIKPAHVIKVLAAATLLQLEGLIQQCVQMMKDTVSYKTVCSYNLAGHMYGQQEVKLQCIHWLEKNLMTSQNVCLLQELSGELLIKLILSPDLFVMQVEMDVYTMIKRWIYLQLHPSWKGNLKHLNTDSDKYYKDQAQANEDCFLLSSEGERFIVVFQSMRWFHVINDTTSLRLIENDKIVPLEWLQPVFQYQWQHMLHADQAQDTGLELLSEEKFRDLCLRCGRVLPSDGEFCWRWTGFSFGFDLLLSYNNRLISIKRNTLKHLCLNAISLQTNRSIYYRLTIACFHETGWTKYTQTTGFHHLSLAKDEEKVILICDREVDFPLHISLNVLFVVKDLTAPLLDIHRMRRINSTLTLDAASQVDESAFTSIIDHSGSSHSSQALGPFVPGLRCTTRKRMKECNRSGAQKLCSPETHSSEPESVGQKKTSDSSDQRTELITQQLARSTLTCT